MAAEQQHLTVPPHSIEAEQAVLGSLLLDGQVWDLIGASIRAGDFYRPDHRLIFEAIAELASTSHAIDVVTVSQQLERTSKLAGVGGLAYLSTLARNTPTSANAASYAGIVRERAALRSLLAFSRRLAAEAVDGSQSVQELASAAQEQLIALQASVRRGRGLVASSALVTELLEDLDRRASGHRGLSIGIANFDEKTGGIDAGDLIVIAARPGMGKTALLITIGAHVARTHTVAVFSAEMPALQLMRRCMALASGISQTQIRRPDRLEDHHWEKITKAAPEISALRLRVDDTAAPTLAHIRAECAALKARGGLELVLIDYLQLMRGDGRSRYEELRDIAYGLKALAKDLGVPVIALAQVNREVEKREDKRPNSADIRDSGAIEEAADIIGMLYREGQYNSDFGQPYVLECNIVKHRNGELGQCLWHFAGEHSLVTLLDSGAALQYRRNLAELRRSRKGDFHEL